MAETPPPDYSPDTITPLPNPETEKSLQKRIHFIGALHRLKLGPVTLNDNSTPWQSEAKRRVHQLHPSMITIDGANSYTQFANTAEPLGYDSAMIREDLPGSVEELTDKPSLLVVRGDVVGLQDLGLINLAHNPTEPYKDATGAISPNWQAYNNRLFALVKDQFEYTHAANQAVITKQIEEDAAIGAAGAVLAAATYFAKRQEQLQAAPQEISPGGQPPERKLSRRSLFRWLAGTGAAAALSYPAVRHTSQVFEATTDNTALATIWHDAFVITRPLTNLSRWLNGRTALLYAKTEDALLWAQQTNRISTADEAAIVMGDMHQYDEPVFAHDTTKRQTAIAEYAADLSQALDQLLAKHPEITAADAHTVLRKLLSYTDIYTLYPTSHHNTDKHTGAFASPQVLAALSL